jgi:uncharacterized protein YbjT (DUF2867 family)
LSKQTILVIGSTGTQGTKVVDGLIKSDKFSVRALTRDKSGDSAISLSHKSVELIEGNMDDLKSLDAAMSGVYGVFFIGIGTDWFDKDGPKTEIERGSNVIQAAKSNEIGHIVFSGVSGGNRSIGVPAFETKGAIERALAESGLGYTILRPVSFIDNFNRNKDAIKEGRLSGILSPNKTQWFISVQNIADFAVAAFSDPERFLGKEIDLAGEAMTLPDVAKIFAQALGTEVKYNHIGEDDRDRLPEPMKMMNQFYEREGYLVDVDELKKEWDIPLMSVSDWIRQEPGWLD